MTSKVTDKTTALDVNGNKKGCTVWFTGLSGAGKTTIAKEVAKRLKTLGRHVERLDGDVVRKSLTKDLGFTEEDRKMNIERVTFVAKLLSRNNVVTLASFISPYISSRDYARQETTNFIEVFVHAPLEVCIERDVKGLYQQAIDGKIDNFTGISHPYEEPVDPEIVVHTHKESVKKSAERIMEYLRQRGFV